MIKKCFHCKKEFKTIPSLVKRGRGKHCSRYCANQTKKTYIAWNKGTKGLIKPNKGSFVKGQEPWNKKYENGYDAVHDWIEKELGLAREGVCEKCGSDKNVEWSNKNELYLRNVNDWQRLCRKCHARYDWERFGAREVFYT